MASHNGRDKSSCHASIVEKKETMQMNQRSVKESRLRKNMKKISQEVVSTKLRHNKHYEDAGSKFYY